mgnify:CR=1 FL=1
MEFPCEHDDRPDIVLLLEGGDPYADQEVFLRRKVLRELCQPQRMLHLYRPQLGQCVLLSLHHIPHDHHRTDQQRHHEPCKGQLPYPASHSLRAYGPSANLVCTTPMSNLYHAAAL